MISHEHISLLRRSSLLHACSYEFVLCSASCAINNVIWRGGACLYWPRYISAIKLISVDVRLYKQQVAGAFWSTTRVMITSSSLASAAVVQNGNVVCRACSTLTADVHVCRRPRATTRRLHGGELALFCKQLQHHVQLCIQTFQHRLFGSSGNRLWVRSRSMHPRAIEINFRAAQCIHELIISMLLHNLFMNLSLNFSLSENLHDKLSNIQYSWSKVVQAGGHFSSDVYSCGNIPRTAEEIRSPLVQK